MGTTVSQALGPVVSWRGDASVGTKPETTCSICALLRVSATHHTEWCYANPKATVIDLWMLSKRISQACSKGTTPLLWLVDAAATQQSAGKTQNWLNYTTITLLSLPHM